MPAASLQRAAASASAATATAAEQKTPMLDDAPAWIRRSLDVRAALRRYDAQPALTEPVRVPERTLEHSLDNLRRHGAWFLVQSLQTGLALGLSLLVLGRLGSPTGSALTTLHTIKARWEEHSPALLFGLLVLARSRIASPPYLSHLLFHRYRSEPGEYEPSITECVLRSTHVPISRSNNGRPSRGRGKVMRTEEWKAYRDPPGWDTVLPRRLTQRRFLALFTLDVLKSALVAIANASMGLLLPTLWVLVAVLNSENFDEEAGNSLREAVIPIRLESGWLIVLQICALVVVLPRLSDIGMLNLTPAQLETFRTASSTSSPARPQQVDAPTEAASGTSASGLNYAHMIVVLAVGLSLIISLQRDILAAARNYDVYIYEQQQQQQCLADGVSASGGEGTADDAATSQAIGADADMDEHGRRPVPLRRRTVIVPHERRSTDHGVLLGEKHARKDEQSMKQGRDLSDGSAQVIPLPTFYAAHRTIQALLVSLPLLIVVSACSGLLTNKYKLPKTTNSNKDRIHFSLTYDILLHLHPTIAHSQPTLVYYPLFALFTVSWLTGLAGALVALISVARRHGLGWGGRADGRGVWALWTRRDAVWVGQ
ncbi:hypothetical protein OC835_007780 [Tilletia horrida]|nr:hypothetical protein OC835_007780 [Tilletia horrida]